MFPCYTSLVLPSLTRRQANAVEFATKACWFSLFGGPGLRGNSATDVGYDGETVQHVVTQKLATLQVYRYTYVDRS